MEPLRLECEDFANSIRLGTQPRASGQSGLEVVRILEQAHASMEAQVHTPAEVPAHASTGESRTYGGERVVAR